jgi:fucose permease
MGLLCALFLLTGLLVNTIDSLSNAVMADLAADTKGRHIGLLQAIFSAVGAGASYFALLLGGDYVTVFFGLALLALASLLPFMLGLRGEMRQPWLRSPQGFGSVRKAVRLLRVRGVLPVVILSFLGMFVQISLCYFLSSYVVSLPNSTGADAFALCMLYSGALIGRLIFARLSHRIDPCRIMIVYNALALAGMVALLLTRNATAAGIIALLPGFGLSANFPGLIVRACGLIPEDSAAASALIFIGTDSAACAAPPLVGLVGDTLGLQPAFALCAVLLIPMIVLSVWMGSRRPDTCTQTV